MYAALTKALTTALVELSRENTPASLEMIASTTKELSTSVTYTSSTLMSTERQRVISPRSHSSKEEGLSSIPSGKEDELSPLPSGSDESHYMFPKESGVKSENISRISENNDSNSVSEQDNFSDFYDKLEGVDIRPVKSTDLRSLSAGEIDLKGLKKSSSCAGLLMTSPISSKDSSEVSSLAPPPHTLASVPHLPFLGRLRHSSAPSGQGTPRSKTSTIDHTPSWISSRGSYTEEGKISIYDIRFWDWETYQVNNWNVN